MTEDSTMKRVALALGGLLVLAITACSADAPLTKTTESPAARASTPQNTATLEGATPADSAEPTPGSVTPASSCLSGHYRLARFVGVGGNATYGAGEGGDVTVAFGSGTYELKGAGKKPITVTLAGQQASLLVAGTISGVHRAAGDKADFTIRQAKGSATLTAGGQTRTLTMDDIGNVLGLTGSGTLACSPGLLAVTLDNVRLEFEKA
jgi:hypothetical protein